MSLKTQDLFNVSNKVVVVTGGSRGIGEMITSGFLANGSRVYITARKEEALISKAEELSKKYDFNCIPVSGDISNTEGITALVNFLNDAEPDGIDFLINNAGAAWGAKYDDFPESGWDKVIDLNLKTPFFLTQKLTPSLEKKGTPEDPSRVVNIASIDGLHVPMMETYSYTASKSGIIHLTKHLAKTLVNRNIIVNAIAPGPFDSHMLGKAVNFDYSFIAESVPRKRIGTPEDIAGLCMYLCSRAGAYTIGETITCDGGLAKLL
ncbi:MAG: 3-oxoacyl-ACP reductase [Gammaproteobacteria bacterium]|nr:3-oxoacyl-ACP reductase [Gammaproteobacteria bacterium]MDC3098893.1 SDR family oxidoreductase [Gammaproteobacteria bacterium]|tara:strand:+ start:3502 stop:4293 length:792 start_codon:yes stop_codon:yes gene_type:complete